MPETLFFLPSPRRTAYPGGFLTLKPGQLILLETTRSMPLRRAGLRSAALRVQEALNKFAGLYWEINASPAVPPHEVGLVLRIAPERSPQPQGYRLHIAQNGPIVIEGHDPAGVFYGVCTLVQALSQVGGGRELPCLEIQDWPDIPARGVMLDISRDKVYTMETLYELIDRLAGWKINQVQLYTEHTFAYRNHPEVWAKASPMTGEEILALDMYCRERFIELVPNQNSFGHMHRWLIHPRYADLAEIHGEIHMPWGTMQGPFSLAPENPGSIALIRSLYDELLPHFSSRMLNVGCDETFDLGQGVSRQVCEEKGTGRVYLDFLLKVYEDVQRRGFTMQFWGDIILQHPELVPLLPRDVIALSWGYEASHPFDREGAAFAASGVPFYVCPGTSAWCTLAGRTDNSLGNLLNAAENGLKYGAIGYLNTDWGDQGHWQAPPISYLGFAAGAGLSWCVESNRANGWAELVSRFAFEDATGTMGQVAYKLGNVYRAVGVEPGNSSGLFWLLMHPPERLLQMGNLDRTVLMNGLEAAMDAIDEAMAPIANERMQRKDAALIRREFVNTANLMRNACRRGLMMGSQSSIDRKTLADDFNEFLEEYRFLWLSRNRPGGLPDSTAQFEKLIKEFSE